MTSLVLRRLVQMGLNKTDHNVSTFRFFTPDLLEHGLGTVKLFRRKYATVQIATTPRTLSPVRRLVTTVSLDN